MSHLNFSCGERKKEFRIKTHFIIMGFNVTTFQQNEKNNSLYTKCDLKIDKLL